MLDGTADMDGSLRLQGGEAGPSYEYGRLEIFLRGFWSNICSLDTFTPDSARVACAALGFGGGASLIFPTPFFDDDVVGFFSSAAHGYADSNVTLESCQPPHTGTRILVPLYTPQPDHNLCMSASKELQIVQQDMTEVSHVPEAAKKGRKLVCCVCAAIHNHRVCFLSVGDNTCCLVQQHRACSRYLFPAFLLDVSDDSWEFLSSVYCLLATQHPVLEFLILHQ